MKHIEQESRSLGQDDNNGSLVGHGDPPYAERSIVRSGRQSMPLYYQNTSTVAVSEAVRAFSPEEDWTVHGADTLRLFIHGEGAPLVETDDGTIILTAAGADIWGTADIAFGKPAGR